MIQKCIQDIIKKNLLSLKDSLEPQRTKLTYMTSLSKSVFINKLNDIANECNNICQSSKHNQNEAC